MDYDKKAFSILRAAQTQFKDPKAKHLREAFESFFGNLEVPKAAFTFSLAHLDESELVADMNAYARDFLMGCLVDLFNVQTELLKGDDERYSACKVMIAPQIKISGYKQQLELYSPLMNLIDMLEIFGRFEPEDLATFKADLNARVY